jgi:hypothetical protein
MKQHKHAQVMKAWLDDTSVELEYRPTGTDAWLDGEGGGNPLSHPEFNWRIKPLFTAAGAAPQPDHHTSHCHQGEYPDTCKYGDSDCTAAPQAQPLTDGEIHTAYFIAANQSLRPQDERIVLAFARAVEYAHGITQGEQQ